MASLRISVTIAHMADCKHHDTAGIVLILTFIAQIQISTTTHYLPLWLDLSYSIALLHFGKLQAQTHAVGLVPASGELVILPHIALVTRKQALLQSKPPLPRACRRRGFLVLRRM